MEVKVEPVKEPPISFDIESGSFVVLEVKYYNEWFL